MNEPKIPDPIGANKYKIYRILAIVFILFICYFVSVEFLIMVGGIFLIFSLNEFRKKMPIVETAESQEIKNTSLLNKDVFDVLSETKSNLSLEIKKLFEAGFSLTTLKKVSFLIINTFTILGIYLFFAVLFWVLEISFIFYLKLPLPIFLVYVMGSPIIPLVVAGLLIRILSKKNLFDNRYIVLKFVFNVFILILFYIFLHKYLFN